MAEDSVKVGGITGMFVYFVYGLAYFAFLSALILGSQEWVLTNPGVAKCISITRALFDRMGGAKSILLTASVLSFISLLTGILLNDLAKKFTIISIGLLTITSLMGIIVVSIMISG